MWPFLQPESNSYCLSRTVDRPALGAVRFEHGVGVDKSKSKSATFQRQRAGAVTIWTDAQRRQLLWRASKKFQAAIWASARDHRARLVTQFARGRTHHCHERVDERHGVDRAHPCVIINA